MAAKKKVAKAAPKEVLEEVVEREIPVPRFNAEGVLLNPEDFNVSPDGFLTPKG